MTTKTEAGRIVVTAAEMAETRMPVVEFDGYPDGDAAPFETVDDNGDQLYKRRARVELSAVPVRIQVREGSSAADAARILRSAAAWIEESGDPIGGCECRDLNCEFTDPNVIHIDH